MRFTADGPDIPEELLVARDKGDVIFFCGAGVSQQYAHLPSFEGLGRDVIRLLGSAQDSPARRLFDKAIEMGGMAGVGGLVATDRIFGLLEREFEVRDVREAVAEAIRPPEGYGRDAHRTLLDLAKSPAGVTRIVTTNFDNLFEECDPELKSSGPPRLPDPRDDRDFRGIVHLHGRVGSEYIRPLDDEFVISSADFGRAYLSEAWATRFIQSLLTRYQIVFVGYTADDPPVQYLLEALNLHAGTRARLFAFQPGDEGEATALWEHRGVRAIPFDDSNGFDVLWASLAAWAERARDVDGWYRRIVERAAAGPSAVDSYFRGAVAKLAGTREGARRIATAAQTLDARWLLVFDPVQRFAEPARVEPFNDDTEMFDPFDVLGLDCDTVPDPAKPDNFLQRRSQPSDAFDPLSRTFFDDEDRGEVEVGALRGQQSSAVAVLPPRLASLGIWLNRLAHEPLALWWASQQAALHPTVQWHIQSSLRQSPARFSEAVRKGWRRLFAVWSDRRQEPDGAIYDIEGRTERDGWSLSLVREAADVRRPQLSVERAIGSRHPFNWGDELPEQLLRVDVEYPRPHTAFQIPDEFVSYAVTQLRTNLELAIAMEFEITSNEYLYLTTTRADDGQALDEDTHGITSLMLAFQNLMARLTILDCEAAQAEVARWPTQDEYVFARLRIWAAAQRVLLESHEAATVFLALSDEVFWGSQHQRDLLYALRDRWPEFDEPDRVALETRLLTGSYPFSDDVRGGPATAAAHFRLSRLHWLSSQGVTFSFDLEKNTAALRKIAPEWLPEFAAGAAESDVPTVVDIDTDETADVLIEVPIPEILAKASEASDMDFRDRVQREPFQGFVARRPIRALLALAHAARSRNAPNGPWRDFLRSDIRKADRPRMICAIAARLCSLPIEQFHGIAYPASEWMRENAHRFFSDASASLPSLWTKMIEALNFQHTRSPHEPDRSWADDALNAPVGKLFDVLMKDPAKDDLAVGAGFPRSWRDRVDELLNLPDDHRRQALVMFSSRTRWLFAIDPAWTEQSILPAATNEGPDGDAFWDGFLWAATTPHRDLYVRLKPALLARALLARRIRHHGRILAGMLLAGWGGPQDAEQPERIVGDLEFRELLIHADDEIRRGVLGDLERWSVGNQGRWRERVVPFLRNVWPKQRALRTPNISERLTELALASGDLMPEVVPLVLPRLVPIRGGRLHGLGMRSEAEDFPARRHPKETLGLLTAILPEDPNAWPYRIERVFEILEQSAETADDSRLAELRRRMDR
jgi:hypothetical protein